MKKRLLLLSAFLVFSVSTYATSNPEADKVIWACAQISPNGNWDYENQFADGFIKAVPKDKFNKITDNVLKGYGKCKKATPLLSQFVPHNYIFSFEKAESVLVTFSINQENKIASFTIGASVPNLSTIASVSRKMVSMRDGVKLDSWVFLPKTTTALPTVLLRTPYTVINGNDALGAEMIPSAAYFNSRGYAFAVQAIRGSGHSEGIYKIFSPQEIEDGEDAINWIGGQTFCNGNVAIQGTSYDGFTSLAAGVNNPKNLKVIFSGGGPTELSHSGLCEEKICTTSILDYLNFNTSKGMFPVFDTTVRNTLLSFIDDFDLTHYDQRLWNKTINEWQLIARDYSDQNPIWEKRSITERLKEIAVPTYHIAGTNSDGNMPDVIRNFKSIEGSPNSPFHHLWLGPWDHGNSTPYTEDNLSPFAQKRFDSLMAYYLKDTASPFSNEKRVMIDTGDKVLSYGHLPFEEFNKIKLYLGRNNKNEGILSLSNQSSVESASYNYLPKQINTFENESQTLFFGFTANQDFQILGPIDINLSLSTTIAPTIILAQLFAVDASGKEKFASNCIGVVRLSSKMEDINNVHFEHCPVMQKIVKGDQLMILFSSNLFPSFFRESSDVGKISIYFDQTHPSTITIPIL